MSADRGRAIESGAPIQGATPIRRLLAWVVLAALAIYLLFFGGAWLGLYLTDLRIVTVVAAAGLLGAWGLVMRSNAAWRPRSVLMPAILLALASLAITTAFSRYPRVSLEYLGYAIVLAALYLLLVRLLADPFFRARLVALASVLFVAIVAAYVFLVVRHWIDWWSEAGVIDVPPLRPEYESLVYGTPSTVLTIVAMLAVPTIATVLPARRGGWVAAVGVLVLVGLIALLTGSRAGWVAMAIAGAVALVLVLVDRDARSALRELATPRVRRLAVAVGAIAVVLAVVLGPAILHRATDGGEDRRFTYTRIALQLFTESPAVGTGPGSWVIERLPNTTPDETDEYIPHAHDVYAQTLGEQGLVGGLAGIFLTASLGLLCLRAMRSGDPIRRRWGWLTLVALVYFGAHQAFDFYPNMPAVLFVAVLPVAFLDALSPTESAPAPRQLAFSTLPRPAGIAAAILIAVSIGGLLLQEIPSLAHDRAVELANGGDWAAALAPATQAADEDPAISPYQFTAGLAAAWAGDHQTAVQRLKIVAERDDFPEAWLDLAAEQAALGQKEAALASLRSALRLGFQRPVITMPAGDLALRLGDTEMASTAFAQTLAVTSSLAGDPWWTSDPTRVALWPDIVRQVPTWIEYMAKNGMSAGSFAPPSGWEVALMHDEADGAMSLASSALDPNYARQIIAAWTGDHAAFEALLGQCDVSPNAIARLIWCARLADRDGDTESGSRYRFVANVQAAGSYRSAHELRVDLAPPRNYPILEGGASIAWGTYTYRRITAWDVLAPGLIRLGFQPSDG